MRCAEIMSTNIHCINAETTARDAARRMRHARIGFLPVCDDKKRVIGTITDRDIALRVVGKGRDAHTPVCEVMTQDPVSCQPAETISGVAKLMSEHRISRVICTDDDGRLVGVVSLSDIAECEDDVLAARTLRDVGSREARASA